MVIQKLYGTFKAPSLTNLPTTNKVSEKFRKAKSKQANNFGSAILLLDNDLATYGLPFQLENGLGLVVFSDPVLLMLKSAKELGYKANHLRSLFPKGDEQELLKLTPSEFYPYIESKLSAVIMLHASLEACINRIIPLDSKYISKKSKSDETLGREECIKLGFEEKFKKVVKSTTGVNFFQKNEVVYNRLLKFTTLRNDLAHLKPATSEKKQYYFPVFQGLIKLDIDEAFDDVVLYINTFIPDFVELTNPPK